MPVVFAQLATIVGGVLVSMAGQLMTERFIKRMLVEGLQAIANKTATDEDNKMLAEAKRAWGIE